MKISSFAEKFNLKKSTVRYYTDIKLLLPTKKGNSYFYDDTCVKDITDIISLKDMGFTVDEISKIKTFERMDISFSHEKESIIKEMFNQKLLDLELDLSQITSKIKKLKSYEYDLSSNKNNIQLGVPLNSFNILCCPHCKSNLNLINGNITRMSIMNGNLSCHCGYSAIIEDGIIDCRTKFFDDENNPLKKERSWREQLSMHSPEISSLLFEQGIMLKEDESFWKDGSIFLINEADVEIFAMRLHDFFKSDGIYILASISNYLLPKLKHLMEINPPKGNFLFISHNGCLPIRSNVDRVIDINAHASKMLYNDLDMNLLRECHACCTPEAKVFMVSMSLSDSSRTLEDNPDLINALSIESIKNYINGSKFYTHDEFSLEPLECKHIPFNHFHDDDLMHFSFHKLRKE